MRVLALQPYLDGAGHFAKYTLRVCEQIAGSGHEVTLVVNWVDLAAYRPGGASYRIVQLGDNYRFWPYEEGRRVSQFRWMYGRMRNNVAVLWAAARLLRAERFDVVQLFSYELVSTWAAMRTFWPSVSPPVVIELAAANFDSARHYGSMMERLWRRLMRRAMRALADWPIRGINVNSGSHSDELRSQLGLPAGFPIEIVSDTREIPETRLSQEAARARIGLSDYKGSVFLFFGTLRRDKGIATLAAAVRAIPDIECRIVIAGMPLDWDFTGPDAALLSDPRVVATRAYVAEEDVDAYFYAADALLLPYPSFYAGSSGPIYDACARALPVIASDVSEMGHFIREHRVGVSVPPEDPDALAAALRLIASLDASTLEGYRTCALNVAKRTTRATVADRFCALYAALT